MSNKNRNIIKGIAVLLVLLAVMMQMQWVVIPAIVAYKFWLVVIAFGLVLVASK
ncbi:MAG: hypothetical protein KF846_05370 [Cyclobacteriaceae bacterium]|nr:hypothetical protein [Cyclobacteriaceae bacterium]MBX2955562.1 hypothetical protein [Cyclobacteriaceae bacterium]HRJ29099.1 hypothetical protein [Cyclobacteriaceae bacterium]HRJ82183.1 hypothetical protein [Cyclobacteriaceae bacterium]